MARLSERDLRGLLELAGEAYDAHDLAEFRAVVLPAILRLIRSDFSSYNELTGAGDVLAAVTLPRLDAAAHETWRRLGATNPLFVAFMRTRVGSARRFSDVVSREELHALPLYQELYRPLGIEHQMSAVLPSSPSIVAAIVLSRGGGDFEDRERQLLDLARPHLAQAYRNAQLRERTRGVVAALRAGLDDASEALLVVDRDGTVAFSTTAALATLAELGLDAEIGRPVPPPLADGSDTVVLGGTPPVTARRVPGRGPADPDAVVLTRGAPGPSTTVLRGLGLTAREAEVMREFVRGHDAPETARRLGISARTVHKHAQSIYAKLGTTGRAAAVATVWAASG